MCTPTAVTKGDRLNVLQIGRATRKRKRIAARVVDEDLSKALKQRLMAERDKYLTENPCFYSIGASLVCPDVTIDEVCSQAEYVETSSDITLFGIRSDLRDRFFNVISSVLTEMVSDNDKRICGA